MDGQRHDGSSSSAPEQRGKKKGARDLREEMLMEDPRPKQKKQVRVHVLVDAWSGH